MATDTGQVVHRWPHRSHNTAMRTAGAIMPIARVSRAAIESDASRLTGKGQYWAPNDDQSSGVDTIA